MPKTQPLSVDLLRIDAGTQSRVKINEDVVEDYADVISASDGDWPFPPLDVFHDGSEYLMGDGFHRILGAIRAKRASVPCRIHPGTAKDARIFSMTANDRHGLRMTRADKRACVIWLLDNGGKMTQIAVAEAAGVSRRLVSMVMADRKAQFAHKGSGGSQSDSGGGGGSGSSGPPKGRKKRSGGAKKTDYGKCPNCAGKKWDEDEDGVSCSRCHHPHGEPAGDVDKDRVTTQRQKTVKTAEALMREFDDLNDLMPKSDHEQAIQGCKELLKTARGWK